MKNSQKFVINSLLPVIVGMATVLTAGAADPLTFSDSFDTPQLNPFWRRMENSGWITVGDTTRAHSGGGSIRLNSTSGGGQKGIGVRHDFEQPQFGEMSVWVYDTGADVSSANYLTVQADNLFITAQDYDFGPNDGGRYYCQVYFTNIFPTAVDRTQGWHEFKIRSTPEAYQMSIDGQVVHSGSPGIPIRMVSFSMYGPTWRPAWVSYFDDFAWKSLSPRASIRVSALEIAWESQPNETYQVEYKTAGLNDPWKPLGTTVAGTGQAMTVTDPIQPGQPQRFYRVIVK
jgi:hypothetical protein